MERLDSFHTSVWLWVGPCICQVSSSEDMQQSRNHCAGTRHTLKSQNYSPRRFLKELRGYHIHNNPQFLIHIQRNNEISYAAGNSCQMGINPAGKLCTADLFQTKPKHISPVKTTSKACLVSSSAWFPVLRILFVKEHKTWRAEVRPRVALLRYMGMACKIQGDLGGSEECRV